MLSDFDIKEYLKKGRIKIIPDKERYKAPPGMLANWSTAIKPTISLKALSLKAPKNCVANSAEKPKLTRLSLTVIDLSKIAEFDL